MSARTKRARAGTWLDETVVQPGAATTVAETPPPPWPFHPGEPRLAPGGPGAEPRWAPAPKNGVGTALGPDGGLTSRVWFTIGQGILTEVFYPRVDQACIRDLQMIVT